MYISYDFTMDFPTLLGFTPSAFEWQPAQAPRDLLQPAAMFAAIVDPLQKTYNKASLRHHFMTW